MKAVKRSELKNFLRAVSEKQRLYIPCKVAGKASFGVWSEDRELFTDANTERSAKDFFFPQVENLVDFKVNGQRIEIIENRAENEDFVVFGVRACDVRSFEILDTVFLSKPVDTYYKNRRDHATIVSLVCAEPEKTCFCESFGIDATHPAGDVRACLTDGYLYLEPLTEKGTAFMELASPFISETDGSEAHEQIASARKKLSELPLAGLKPQNLSEKQLDIFKSPKWAKLSEACLGCGSCTFSCPTCQCYDIRDFDTGEGFKRYRCWDSCMYSDFTLMASGTPRLSQLERFRQRFMHKLVYYPANNGGAFGCVGCGRCVKKCPVSMNIVKVMKSLSEVTE